MSFHSRKATVEGALKAAIGSKLVGWVDFFTPLVAKACLDVQVIQF